MISSCLGVLIYDRQTDKWTEICDCRVAFATENAPGACCYSKLLVHFFGDTLLVILYMYFYPNLYSFKLV